MNFKNLKVSFSQLRGQNQFLIYSNTALAGMLTVSLFVNFQKDTIVINNMNESCNQSEISSSSMNEANHRRLGFLIAGMLGNITPKNSEYIKKSVLPFASPEIYHRVADLIALQLAELKQEEVTMSFTAERAFVEDGKTFVTGKGAMRGLTGKEKPYVRTYELIFSVENYTPTFSYINVYDDVPHDSVWQARNMKREAK
ncbi:hypothetical protein CAG54_11125 [Vibrio sp. V27_P1S3P104]|uniref:TraE/TraK family type IV conjugative transfer system protein n=1 Tax=unclassified Vibrio TaxID=2614977 RepID=UPI00137257DE|nr:MULTISPECIES: TraE/TraK family type IV conjugative transfer system protein [unclassified Vibrio]NAX35474.1 hypothetical protein [Vibrio sp. V29_P1S30P107]NAX38048.1 hypothetical protein [Vibrio sp. V27_P1S3P104]